MDHNALIAFIILDEYKNAELPSLTKNGNMPVNFSYIRKQLNLAFLAKDDQTEDIQQTQILV